MTLTTERLHGTELIADIPQGWRVGAHEGLALAAVDPDAGEFAPNVTVIIDARNETPTVWSAAAVLASMANVVPVDIRALAKPVIGVEMLFCHLVGSVSVTTLQRQVATSAGAATVTVSCATADWGRIADLATQVVASVREAS